MDKVSETTHVIKSLPGGQKLLDWFDGSVPFGDAEVVDLCLRRKGPSLLTLTVGQGAKAASVTFILEHWIDVHFDGFSHQNVISDLQLRHVTQREAATWELGVGARFGETEIDLAPCFGANGIIRANISAVRFARVDDGCDRDE